MRDWIIRLIMLAVIGALCLGWAIERRHADKLAKQVGELVQARADDAQRFKQASVEASEYQRLNIVRVSEEQGSISERAADDYRKELVALRQRYSSDGLRRDGEADPGRADAGDVPTLPTAAAGADEPAASFACAADALQLSALQDWNRKQAAIDPNAP